MTEPTRSLLTQAVKYVFTLLAGGLLTMTLSYMSQTNKNTSDIAVIKSMIEPLKDAPSKLSELNTKADRNYDAVTMLQDLVIKHMAETGVSKK